MATRVEQELVKAAKFRGTQDDRQDYLAALVRKLEKVSEDTFNDLSDGAADWYDAAALAINKKDEIPDFTPEPDEVQAVNGAADVVDAEPELPGADPAETDPGDEPEPEPEVEHGETEQEAPKAVSKAKRGRPAKPKDGEVKEGAFKVKAKATPERFAKMTGAKDKFGVVAGTKASEAMAMFEKGATAIQVHEAISGKFMNTLKRLKELGHKVEKQPGGKWKLTHKNDL